MVRSALAAAAGSTSVVSETVRAEALVKPVRDGDSFGIRRIEAFLSNLEFATLRRDAFDVAIELRAHHGLKMPDALNVAAAITSGCDEFWTNDSRLKVVGQRVRIRVVGETSGQD